MSNTVKEWGGIALVAALLVALTTTLNARISRLEQDVRDNHRELSGKFDELNGKFDELLRALAVRGVTQPAKHK